MRVYQISPDEKLTTIQLAAIQQSRDAWDRINKHTARFEATAHVEGDKKFEPVEVLRIAPIITEARCSNWRKMQQTDETILLAMGRFNRPMTIAEIWRHTTFNSEPNRKAFVRLVKLNKILKLHDSIDQPHSFHYMLVDSSFNSKRFVEVVK